MSIQERRERERAQRHQMIVTAARELAETEGWDAVTTRRLSDRVEYSQPVLYSHFANKDAIVAAVAIEGFGELAKDLRRARTTTTSPKAALRALADAYLDFAASHPALYDAMFTQSIDVAFGRAETPAPLQDAFGEFVIVLETVAKDRDVEVLAEVAWSALHGLATLTQGDRLRPDYHHARVNQLVGQILG
jgi:AcrR family transcriptional regulator